jgi:hypothetical protein
MSCHDQTPCVPCAPSITTGCLDIYNTDCVKYTGDAIECLDIASGDTLTDILGHLEDVICALAPTSYADFDYGCFSTENIQTEEEWVEFSAALFCEILGTQEAGGVTPLSTLATNISNLSVQVNNVVNVTTLDCFEAVTGLPGPTATLSTLLGAVQQVLCDHDDDIQGLVALGGLGITGTDSDSINLTISGVGNHTIEADVNISADSGNSLSIETDGLYVSAPDITVSDTATVNLTASGLDNHTLQADVKISAVGGNQIIAQVDGIYAPAASLSETAITVNDSSTIDFTASGTSNHTITGSVIIDPAVDNIISSTGSGIYASGSSFALGNNSVTDLKLRDSIAYSVIGRSSGSTGDPADIVAPADGVLRRSGSGDLSFGSIVAGNITNGQVTLPKLQNLASQQILGRSSGGPGAVEHLTLGSHLVASGGTINTYGRTLIGVTVFNSDGTWTRPSGCNAAVVYIVGAGGGGASVDSDAAEVSVGTGGGAGATLVLFKETGLGGTETVTVGVGGVGGTVGNPGSNGGDSSFGAHGTAGGGSGGLFLASDTTVMGADGGSGGLVAVVPADAIYSTPGESAASGVRFSGTQAIVGPGGSSTLGASSVFGNGPGAGGFGRWDDNGTDLVGNDGGDGIVIVYEYS